MNKQTRINIQGICSSGNFVHVFAILRLFSRIAKVFILDQMKKYC